MKALRVLEKCWIGENEHGEKLYGNRVYDYATEKKNLMDAFVDMDENWDCENILVGSASDDFEEDCLDSEIIKIELISLEEK